jgi:hemoglobin
LIYLQNMNAIPSLYDWAGGKDVLENLTAVFYGKVLRDELLEPVFRNMPGDHSRHVAHFIGEVFGGPKLYTAADQGSHYRMVEQHVGRMLDEPKRKRWMDLLLQSCDEVGIPSDPEFRSALVGYLEWGSRLAVINSYLHENPLREPEPMPAWGWGETKGPYIP